MKLDLFIFDLKTKLPTGEVKQVAWPESKPYIGLTPKEIFDELGLKETPNGTFWEPPSEQSLFIGSGWALPQDVDKELAAHLLINNDISVGIVESLDLELEVTLVLKTLLRNIVETKLRDLDSKYTQQEKDSWELQESEAREFIANGTKSELLTTLAELKETSVKSIALDIVSNSTSYRQSMIDRIVMSNQLRIDLKQAEGITNKRKALLFILNKVKEEIAK